MGDEPILLRALRWLTFQPVWLAYRLIWLAAKIDPDARIVLRTMWAAGLDVRCPEMEPRP